MSILKIAQVGCGGMGRWYRHRYNEVEGARLELVIDTNEEAAKKAAEELNCVLPHLVVPIHRLFWFT